jgi:hypothetical protein
MLGKNQYAKIHISNFFENHLFTPVNEQEDP